MALYTITFSKLYPSRATYYATSAQWDERGYRQTLGIIPPVWNDGRKTFGGYWVNLTEVVNSSGTCYDLWSISSNKSATEKWTTVAPAAVVYSGSSLLSELVYDGGVWYSDYANRTVLDATHPMAIPTKEKFRFLGCYSTNATTGTKYVNADGTPTDELLALSPSDDFDVYAQFEQVSWKVTVSHSSGTPASTVFYAKIGVSGEGRFFSDDLCTTPVTRISPPSRELYRWNGSFSSSTTSSANTYIDRDGFFQQKLYNLSITADKSLGSYSNYWTATNFAKITLEPHVFLTLPINAYYTDKTVGGIYEHWLDDTTEPGLSYLPIPSRDLYRFLGYYSTTNTEGTKYVDYDGKIEDALKTAKAAKTIHAVAILRTREYTLDDNGGSGGVGKLYNDSTNLAMFDSSSRTVTSVQIPTKAGHVFKGYFNGDTCMVDEHGNVSYVNTTGLVYTARWERISATITVDRGDGTGGTSFFYFNGSDERFYSDSSCTSQISSVTLPTKDLFDTVGLVFGQTQVVDSSGGISPSWFPSSSIVTLTATYTRRCYRTSLEHDGGTSSASAIYRGVSSSSWYSDSSLGNQVSSVPVPTKTGYTFAGYRHGSSLVIGSSGTILSAASVASDYTAVASWDVKNFTVAFSTNGGTCSEQTRTVQEGQPVGSLPTPTKTGYSFDGWYTQQEGGRPVGPGETITADVTFSAHWTPVEYQVSYVLNGGTNAASNPSEYTIEETVSLADPTRSGYVFGGWSPSSSIPSGSTGAKTFTASWIPIVYKTAPSAIAGLTYSGTSQTGVSFDSSLSHSGTVSAVDSGSYSATFSLPADTSSAVYRWAGGGTGSVTVPWSIGRLSVTSASVTFGEIRNQVKTGSQICPDVKMYLGSSQRTADVDFTVAYANNVNVGTATATVTGIGNFTGTKVITFTIEEPPVDVVFISKPYASSGIVYTGSPQAGVTYDPRLTSSGQLSATDASTYVAVFTLPQNTSSENYRWSDGSTDSVTVSWTISPLQLSDSSLSIGSIPDQSYTGSSVTPTVTLARRGVSLTQGTDFTVSYENNVAVGTATATATGIGNFSGTRSTTFGIIRGTINVGVPTAIQGLTYSKEQQVGVSYDPRLILTGSTSATNAGSYSATFSLPPDTQTSTYAWTDGTTSQKTVSWYISPKSVDSLSFSGIADMVYTGNPQTPAVTVRDGGTDLSLGTDFNVSYSNNTNIGTAVATVSGIGNYTGTRTVTFQIVAPDNRVVTFDGRGGTPSEASRTVVSGSLVGALPTASRSGYDFIGWYTLPSGGVEVTPHVTIYESVTFYARWQAVVYSVSYVLNGGTNNALNPSTYTTEDSVTLLDPTRDGFAFTGWSPNGGVIPAGSTGDKTFTASWSSTTVRVVTFDATGGTSSESSRNVIDNVEVGNLPTASRNGYSFVGWYTDSSGGSLVTSSYVVTHDVTFYSRWTAIQYTLTFDGNGAAPSFSTKTVTYGATIGALPSVSMGGRVFDSWQVDGGDIKSTDVWGIASDKTAVAKWKDEFGDPKDYFSLAGNILMVVRSESGEGRTVTNLWNGAYEQGPGLLNPVCTYRIKGTGNVSIRIGRSFSSGYFITGFEYATGADREPILVVIGTANEGADAINLYDVTFRVSKDHVAQDPFSSVSGGGELVEMTSSVTCDPVVPYENNRPCASDVVHARKRVSGMTAAYLGESRPTFLNSFIESGVPSRETDVDFATYQFTAERAI